jgi:hypothetical protein
LKAAKSSLAKLLKSGSLKLTCTLSAPGTCKVTLVLIAKVARKLGLHVGHHAKTVTLGTVSIKLSTAGAKTTSLKLSRSVVRSLKHAHGALEASLTATAQGASGAAGVAKPIALAFH